MLETIGSVLFLLYLLHVISTGTLLIMLQMLFVLTSGSILLAIVRKTHLPRASRLDQNSNLVFGRL